MATATSNLSNSQIPMPGMPRSYTIRRILSSGSVEPGQIVEYQGRISGGPRFGLKGRVVKTRGRQAIVDMGTDGTWHIPYYFLAEPQAA